MFKYLFTIVYRGVNLHSKYIEGNEAGVSSLIINRTSFLAIFSVAAANLLVEMELNPSSSSVFLKLTNSNIITPLNSLSGTGTIYSFK